MRGGTTIATLTPTAKISRVGDLLARADLVSVSYGADGHTPKTSTPRIHILVRGGNPRLRASLRSPSLHIPPKFPRMELDRGEFELELSEGSTQVQINSRTESGTVLEGGGEDPVFQAWLDRQVERIGIRAATNRDEALQLTTVSGRGRPTQWTAILEPAQVGLSTPQRETVDTPGA